MLDHEFSDIEQRSRFFQIPSQDRSCKGLYQEKKWRCLDGYDGLASQDVVVTKWVDPRNSLRREIAQPLPNKYILGIALKTTQLRLMRGRKILFDGIMPAGTLHITSPSSELTGEFMAPLDFIHFYVSSEYFDEHHKVELNCIGGDRLNDLFARDPLAEYLGRAANKADGDQAFIESIGSTLVMHVARLERKKSKVNPLVGWRLQRVREYVEENLHLSPGLAELAKIAGQSRMHFAAQFRAATGFCPHEYLLYRRIARAKLILTQSDTPLAEVALMVGFKSQAHFSTVFKRISMESPARWRASTRDNAITSDPVVLRSNPERAPRLSVRDSKLMIAAERVSEIESVRHSLDPSSPS